MSDTGSPVTPFSGVGSAPNLSAEEEHDSHPVTAQRSLSTTTWIRRRDYRDRAMESRKEESDKKKAQSGAKEGRPPRSLADMKRTRSEPKIADDELSLPKIRVGICAMDKKARSRPMNAIGDRMLAFGEFEVVYFGDECILNKPITEWPTCECLLSWHSDGFPLHKAQQYAALRKPYLINDMVMQDLLLDRRKVYKTLGANGIPVPHHIIVNRDNLPEGQEDPEGFVETEDYVEINGVQIKKPFVEKPANAEDHNIYIYYPHSMGGGVKRLYRKIEDKSGDYDSNHPGTIRRDGSYIIEEFLTTGGTDVKVYTVGPRYAHAEARKSPVVDGKVTRSADGKELRFPVLLSPQEKEIARMVCLAFGQKVCGFDLLRNERGKSYVCDVNGWSFVKNSHKYYDDAAGILRSIVLSAIAPHRLATAPPQLPSFPRESRELEGSCTNLAGPMTNHDTSYRAYADGDDGLEERDSMEELRCVLAVIRHGDRTPKQKMKMKVTQPSMLELLQKNLDSKGKQAKLKSPQELQDLLDVTRQLLQDFDDPKLHPAETPEAKADLDEVREKFRIVKTVLEQGGHFAGINRKVQLKPTAWSTPPEDSGEAAKITEALLILKHGGVLTHAGRQQAEALGNVFRTVMYPMNGPAGGGLLRLHSTYRHDLKIYSSDEGRVQTSAAAFTQGLLDLEGTSLTPILVSLVKKDVGLLDAFGKGASDDIQRAKEELYMQMTYNPASNTSLAVKPQLSATTPLMSPPLSPRHYEHHPLSPNGSIRAGFLASEVSGGSPHGSTAPLSDDGSLDSAVGRRISADMKGRPVIHPMPERSILLLKRLVSLLKVLVEQLRQKCLEEKVSKGADPSKAYSALTQSAREWELEPTQPCGGERLLLLFDRWRKLLKAFYNEKKKLFDISKVPDIYDSAKYDAIHNSHLGVSLEELYNVAKVLADSVIPNEYGIDPEGKLHIGSKICTNLLGKILSDLSNMREESLATADMEGLSEPVSPFDSYDNMESMASMTLRDSSLRPPQSAAKPPSRPPGAVGERASAPPTLDAQSAFVGTSSNGVVGGEDADVALEVDEDSDSEPPLHRLCPAYAEDINSPLRHVRTRIYFTSESHVHSLINVLRYCHLGNNAEGQRPPLVSEAALQRLWDTPELDYLTHLVFRMYENKRVPVESPQRFRVEILFSPGASHNPYEVLPPKHDHTLPVQARTPLHQGTGMTWNDAQDLLAPLSTPFKPTATPRG